MGQVGPLDELCLDTVAEQPGAISNERLAYLGREHAYPGEEDRAIVLYVRWRDLVRACVLAESRGEASRRA